MAAPYPRRGPMQGQARALNRGAKGMGQGRFAGLSPVTRPGRVASTGANPNLAWDGDSTYIIYLDDVIVGASTIYDYVFNSAFTLDDSLTTVPFLNSTLNFTAAGMYQVYLEVTADGSTDPEPAGFSYMDTYLQMSMSLTGAGHAEFKDQRMVTAFAGFHGTTGITPQAWNLTSGSSVAFTDGVMYVQRVVYPT